MSSDRISQPFAAEIQAGNLYDVIFEIAIDPAAPGVDPYGTLAQKYGQLAEAIGVVQVEPDSIGLIDPQHPVIAPYVFARLLGAQIEQIATANAAIIAKVWPNKARARLRDGFTPADLVSEVIAEPLGTRVRTNPNGTEEVIIHLNATKSRTWARENVLRSLDVIRARGSEAVQVKQSFDAGHPYVFAKLSGYAILALVDYDRNPVSGERAIYRIWEDSKLHAFITESIATVKADAAQIAYSAVGRGIVWAVLDSGIDKSHPHFTHFKNLDLTDHGPIAHKDFSGQPGGDLAALEDVFGHGTHVAGIIAGAMSEAWPDDSKVAVAGRPPPMQAPVAVLSSRNEAGVDEKSRRDLHDVAGMAPQCGLVSLRVLNDDGTGNVSALISAIDQIQQWNDYGRHVVVHGANFSVGYPFEAEWFACGQSPICIEINRLVNSGVVAVVAAGNSGYGYVQTEYTGATAMGLGISINDPGNADLAITVGSTHRTAPHLNGVSYFSSKGPTGDGRLKPDVLAPGERIISCAASQSRTPLTVVERDGSPPSTIGANDYTYKEDSGTSMAAPHVSGIIAGLLSIRREYIGRPLEVKSALMAAATDLGRHRTYQGAGLVDLMRTIQSL